MKKVINNQVYIRKSRRSYFVKAEDLSIFGCISMIKQMKIEWGGCSLSDCISNLKFDSGTIRTAWEQIENESISQKQLETQPQKKPKQKHPPKVKKKK